MRVLCLPALCLAITLGCADRAAEPAAPAAATTAPPAAAPVAMVAAHSGEAVSAPAPTGPAATAAGLVYALPDGWKEEAPSSSMRMAQATIPGPGGDGQLAVFFFGVGGGGDVESNLARWVGQMVPNAGEEPKRDAFAAGPLKVTWIELGGTLKASQFGMGPSTDQAGQRLFGAVVEGPGGPWFFKATGPEATMTANREAFRGMLQALRPAG